MNKIIAKKCISERLIKLDIMTSFDRSEIKPGQYILLIVEKDDVGIPAVVVNTDLEVETITVLVYSTEQYACKIGDLKTGSAIFGIKGPLGHPITIENFGTVLCLVTGPGIVLLLPALVALRAAGNRIVTILKVNEIEDILLEKEVGKISDEVVILTENGSKDEKKSVCQVINQILKNNKVGQMIVIGSGSIIKIAGMSAHKNNIPIQTRLFLDQNVLNNGHGIYKVHMSDLTDGVCVDGHNFNGWYPNLEEMIKRFGREENTCDQIKKGVRVMIS